MNDQPPITQPPPKAEELRRQLISQLQGYCTSDDNIALTNVISLLADDKAVGFFNAPFHMGRGSRYAVDHGLYLATSEGIPILNGFCKVVQALYGSYVQMDQILACYMCIMTGRWCNLQTAAVVYPDPGIRPCQSSMDTNSVVNAVYLGLPMNHGNVLALTKWTMSKNEITATMDEFQPEWWVIHETLYWILVQSSRP